MLSSTFIDFSFNISGKTRSILDLNKNNLKYQLIAESLGFSLEMLAIPEQIHSAKVKCIDTPGDYIAVDGLITNNPEIILINKVADCVPVYIYEATLQIIGLIHSGWRGTAECIVNNAINKMLEMGANEKDIHIFLGPAIGFCCYEVDGEVASNYNNKAKRKMENGKWKVGLHKQICIQLIEMGIPSTNLKLSNICTFESPSFHSYRRDGSQAARMFAFMGLK